MNRLQILIAFLIGLLSCGQNPIKKSLTREIWTIYSKQETTFHIKRLLSTDTGLTLQSYKINTANPEVSFQTFINSKRIADQNEGNQIINLNPNYNWRPYKSPPTLLVQISGSAFKYDTEPWDKEDPIIDSIEKALKLQGHAEWTGCDVGPGGLNMFFECYKIDDAIPVILTILKKYGYEKKTIIARQISTEVDDWFYEVLYPNNYNGKLLTM